MATAISQPNVVIPKKNIFHNTKSTCWIASTKDSNKAPKKTGIGNQEKSFSIPTCDMFRNFVPFFRHYPSPLVGHPAVLSQLVKLQSSECRSCEACMEGHKGQMNMAITTHDHPHPPMAIPPLVITTLILTTKETQVVFVQRSEEMVVTCMPLRVSGFKHSPPSGRSMTGFSHLHLGQDHPYPEGRNYRSSNHNIYGRNHAPPEMFFLDFTTNYQPQLYDFSCCENVYHHFFSVGGFRSLHPWLPHCQAKLTSCKGLHKVIVDTNLE